MAFRKPLCALLLVSVAGSALYAAKDDSQFVPGKLVYLQHKKTTVYSNVDANSVPHYASTTKNYAFVVKIGDTFYTGDAKKDSSLSGRLAAGISHVGNFNDKDWAKLDTNDVMVRFEKKGVGWQGIAMTVRQPNGKETTMYLMSIVGPDGKEQCGKKTGCTGHNWDQVPHGGSDATAAPAQ